MRGHIERNPELADELRRETGAGESYTFSNGEAFEAEAAEPTNLLIGHSWMNVSPSGLTSSGDLYERPLDAISRGPLRCQGKGLNLFIL